MTTPINTVGNYTYIDNSTGLVYSFQIKSQIATSDPTIFAITATLSYQGFGTTGPVSNGYLKTDPSDPSAGYICFAGVLGAGKGTASVNGYCEDFGSNSSPLYLTIGIAQSVSGGAHDATHMTKPFTR